MRLTVTRKLYAADIDRKGVCPMSRDDVPQLKLFQRMRRQKPVTASGTAEGLSWTPTAPER